MKSSKCPADEDASTKVTVEPVVSVPVIDEPPRPPSTPSTPQDTAASGASDEDEGRPRRTSTSSSCSFGLGAPFSDDRSRSTTPNGPRCLDVPGAGGRRWSGGESPSPRGALSPLLELRRPHCTLNCSTCNAILEEKYKHSESCLSHTVPHPWCALLGLKSRSPARAALNLIRTYLFKANFHNIRSCHSGDKSLHSSNLSVARFPASKRLSQGPRWSYSFPWKFTI